MTRFGSGTDSPPPRRLASNYEKYNPNREPDWRHRRLLDIVDSPSGVVGRCTPRDDDWIKEARAYKAREKANSAQNRDQSLMFYENSGLYYALEWHARAVDNIDTDTTFYIETRLLAGQSSAEIAARHGVMPEAVDWYEALFFNVRDRYKNVDWITKKILIPLVLVEAGIRLAERADQRRGAKEKNTSAARTLRSTAVQATVLPYYDATVKMFAYYCGPVAADCMLNSFPARMNCRDEADFVRKLESHFTRTMKQRSSQAAMVFEINKFNVLETINTAARFMELERNTDQDALKQTDYAANVQAMFNELNWSVGKRGHVNISSNVLPYSNTAAELRDDEIIGMTTGAVDHGSLEGLEVLKLPEVTREIVIEAKKTAE